MIQFNLLPDVKLQFIKAQHVKRAVVIIASLVAGVALASFIGLYLVVAVFQQRHMKNVSQEVKDASNKLQENTDLNKILTVQNQLISLPDLHNKKPVVSRLSKYISDVTPSKANISELTVDFTLNTMIIKGTADTVPTINKFADTLKFTDYSNADGSQQGKAFSNVVLEKFDVLERENVAKDGKKERVTEVTYEIKLNFDPAIFDGLSDKSLKVPKTITTRSETEKPEALFKRAPVEEEGQE